MTIKDLAEMSVKCGLACQKYCIFLPVVYLITELP